MTPRTEVDVYGIHNGHLTQSAKTPPHAEGAALSAFAASASLLLPSRALGRRPSEDVFTLGRILGDVISLGRRVTSGSRSPLLVITELYGHFFGLLLTALSAFTAAIVCIL